MKALNIELLAPAGDLLTLKEVALSGADAVYFGGELFSARKNAKNLNYKEAEEGLRFLHLRNKKGYLTVNTLLKNKEMEESLYSYLKAYIEAGIDAVIIQDIGVLHFIRSFFPNLNIHASTQMSGTSGYIADFLKEQGVKRLVTARELSLKEIKDIHKNNDIEIETFIHGALCVCYSGNCLMSSILGGRSGNRGLCAQPCRMAYDVLSNDKRKLKAPGKYMLSPKDLYSVYDLKEMISSGIYSFKIEGRLKSTEYASGVTRIYREAFDKISAGEDFSESDLKNRLLSLGNREGFTDLYHHKKNGKEMMAFKDSSHKKEKIENNKEDIISLNKDHRLLIDGDFFVDDDLFINLSVKYLDKSYKMRLPAAEPAKSAPTKENEIRETLLKTGNTDFKFKELNINLPSNVFIPMKKIKELRKAAFSGLINEIEDKEECYIIKPYVPLKKEYKENSLNKKIKRTADIKALSQLDTVLEGDFFNTIGLPLSLYLKDRDAVKRIKDNKKDVRLILPPAIRYEFFENIKDVPVPSFDEFMPFSYDGLYFLLKNNIDRGKIRLSDNLYVFNDYSKDFYRKLGINKLSSPFELNKAELTYLLDERFEVLLYGRYPLMYMKNCINQGTARCDKKEKVLFLKDRLNINFPVLNDCAFCYNTVYNSLPLCLINEEEFFKSLDIYNFRYHFTTESKDEIKSIKNGIINIKDATKGHFNRGVK